MTWKGKPIPMGQVFFTPDVKKGTTGPQGLAIINNGKFDTRFDDGRGCVAGHQIVSILAYDGKGIGRLTPYGNEMLADKITLEIEVPAVGGAFNLKIPESAAPATAPTNTEI